MGAADPGCTVRIACEGGPTGFEAACSIMGAYSLCVLMYSSTRGSRRSSSEGVTWEVLSSLVSALLVAMSDRSTPEAALIVRTRLLDTSASQDTRWCTTLADEEDSVLSVEFVSPLMTSTPCRSITCSVTELKILHAQRLIYDKHAQFFDGETVF